VIARVCCRNDSCARTPHHRSIPRHHSHQRRSGTAGESISAVPFYAKPRPSPKSLTASPQSPGPSRAPFAAHRNSINAAPCAGDPDRATRCQDQRHSKTQDDLPGTRTCQAQGPDGLQDLPGSRTCGHTARARTSTFQDQRRSSSKDAPAAKTLQQQRPATPSHPL